MEENLYGIVPIPVPKGHRVPWVCQDENTSCHISCASRARNTIRSLIRSLSAIRIFYFATSLRKIKGGSEMKKIFERMAERKRIRARYEALRHVARMEWRISEKPTKYSKRLWVDIDKMLAQYPFLSK